MYSSTTLLSVIQESSNFHLLAIDKMYDIYSITRTFQINNFSKCFPLLWLLKNHIGNIKEIKNKKYIDCNWKLFKERLCSRNWVGPFGWANYYWRIPVKGLAVIADSGHMRDYSVWLCDCVHWTEYMFMFVFVYTCECVCERETEWERWRE